MHASSTIENHSISGVEEDLEQRKVKGYRRNIFENTFVFMEREREREKEFNPFPSFSNYKRTDIK